MRERHEWYQNYLFNKIHALLSLFPYSLGFLSHHDVLLSCLPLGLLLLHDLSLERSGQDGDDLLVLEYDGRLDELRVVVGGSGREAHGAGFRDGKSEEDLC